MEAVIVFLFWASLALLAYIYFGYPAVAWLRAKRPALPCRAPIRPLVSVIVVVHNEAYRIFRRIENLASSDYPRECLEIIIGSDGSTDDTIREARRYVDERVALRSFRRRRGKAAVLNDLIPTARGEIVVLADARQRFEPDAIRALVENFADPAVGAVSGQLFLRKRSGTTPAGDGAGFYWQYEKFIRANESLSGSTVGATGAIYAIRRELFEKIPVDTILDDVLIPLRIVRKGYRVLYEGAARAYDLMATNPREDFVRKTRTIAGTFQLFRREAWVLNPRVSPVWFEAASHKALRLTIPVLHVALLVSNILLVAWNDAMVYDLAMVGQAVFYGAALFGWIATIVRRRRPLLLTVPYTMCLLGWATIVGFARFVARRQRVTWERIPGEPGPRVASRPV
jgi:cellulose synthase/poly-beta-1,6-N-acetylglucosamine synthase-like glycosyltransferase